MSYVEAVLVARARKEGRGQRSALHRHRHITTRPLGMVGWQLGAEPFTAAALAWGFGPNDRTMVVPGEPRNRQLAFRALTIAAKGFNAWFETDLGEEDGPQVVVPNRGMLTLLARLGRRLAYLSTDGPVPADPDLIRFGRHLQFLAKRADHPGQQLIVVLTDLLADHWVTDLSPLELQSLPALDAAIAPPKGKLAHEAVLEAETVNIGPAPGDEEDTALEPFLDDLNSKRARSVEEDVVRPLLAPIERHYEKLVDRGWPLLWKCLDRERTFKEAPHVFERWEEDVREVRRHIAWVTAGRGYRTRATSLQAARRVQGWEDAQRLLTAAEAIDDPLRMAPYFLSNDAIRGKVTEVDLDFRPDPNRRLCRPLVYLETEEPCTLPVGKQLWFTADVKSKDSYVITNIRPKGKGSRVTLQHQTSGKRERPKPGRHAVFSIHNLTSPFFVQYPPQGA